MRLKNHVIMYLPVWALLFISINIFSQNNDNDTNYRDTLRMDETDTLRLRPDTTGIFRDSLDFRRDTLDNKDNEDLLKQNDTTHIKRDTSDMRNRENDGDMNKNDNDFNKDNGFKGNKYFEKTNKIRNLFYIPSFRNNIKQNNVLFTELISGKINYYII